MGGREWVRPNTGYSWDTRRHYPLLSAEHSLQEVRVVSKHRELLSHTREGG